MNPPVSSPLKAIELLAFLATGIIGWQFAAPSAPAVTGKETVATETQRSPRPPRVSRSSAADLASKRVGPIRALADPEARLLASLSLAESLSPAEFGEWMDHSWFDLRGGPELMIFSKILMDRWQQEDPEGLLRWAAKNQNGAADGVMNDWAARDPQRLIEWFKSHRDDRKELAMLSKIAATSPDLALQRLRELADTVLAPAATGDCRQLMAVLAAKSPDALQAMADNLPPALKLQAEGAMSRLRLEASFQDEIANLCSRPDGWKIFSSYVESTNGISEKLLGELANLPPEWRGGMARNSWSIMNGASAQQWWDADLEGAGFSSGDAKSLRAQALQHLAGKDPAMAVQHLVELDLESYQRQNIIDYLFSVGDLEKARGLIAGLQTEEDREMATRILDRRATPGEVAEVKTPEDLLTQLATAGGNSGSYFSQMKDWDPDKLSALAGGFKALPEEQKQRISQVMIDNIRTNGAPANLRDEAIRYYAANPPEQRKKGSEGPDAQIFSYIVNLSTQDPAAASALVTSFPTGNTKAWAQKNLLNNWKQYDPKAAAAWEKSLPPAERTVMEKLGRPGD